MELSELNIRPEDFRHAWANALARAQMNAFRLIGEVGTTAGQLEETRKSVVALIKLSPQMVEAAEQQIAASTSKNIELLNAVGVTLKAQQEQFLADFAAQQKTLTELRAQNDARLSAITLAQRDLDKKRAEFNSLSLIQRLFGKA